MNSEEDETRQELWRDATLVASAPRFAISELFRRQREAAATLEQLARLHTADRRALDAHDRAPVPEAPVRVLHGPALDEARNAPQKGTCLGAWGHRKREPEKGIEPLTCSLRVSCSAD